MSIESLTEELHRLVIEETKSARGGSIQKRPLKPSGMPAAAWIADARISSEIGKALSIVFSTVGCAYARSAAGGCTMCSYLLDGTQRSPSPEELVQQFMNAMSKIEGENGPVSVKLYTSGSFLDPGEVPVSARAAILERLGNDSRVRQVILESRPEYVSHETMVELRQALGDLEVELGIGLESSNDLIRSVCINKGFSSEDFRKAVEIAKAHEIGVRAYVLVKPPFLTERDALLDAKQTIDAAEAMGVTTVSINPVNVQRYTLVERMWSRGEYRPPWLWTVLDVLRNSRKSVRDSINIVCDPVAAGKLRGAHNCGVCDEAISQAIRKFSLVQDESVLEGLDCDCLSVWRHVLEHEDFSLLVHNHGYAGQ